MAAVCAAQCSHTPYYAWTPNRQLTYKFESQVLSGIPDINKDQHAGVRLVAFVRVQTFSDYSLRIQFEQVPGRAPF